MTNSRLAKGFQHPQAMRAVPIITAKKKQSKKQRLRIVDRSQDLRATKTSTLYDASSTIEIKEKKVKLLAT